MHAGERLHYMDNLRALAMLAGVAFHAALAYSPLVHPFFPTADRASSTVVDVFAWFLHLFRMPLFFAVAGFFAALLVQRRGLAGMFRDRLLRIALPFVLAWPLVHAALVASTLDAAATATHPSPLLKVIGELVRAGGLPQQLPGTGHLWFLYYLMFFYVLVWSARTFGLGRYAARIAALHPAWLLAALPVLLIPALASVTAPHPAPESVLPQFWAFGYYGPFFALGYLVHGEPAMIDRLKPHAMRLLAGSVLAYIGFLALLDQRLPQAAAGSASWPIATLEAAISVWMTLACLCFGRRRLARSQRVLRYLADASYWIYIVHLPVLFAIQYRLMDLDLHWTAKLSLSLVLTLAACLLGYELLVRRTVLARMLGRRRTHVPAAAAPLLR